MDETKPLKPVGIAMVRFVKEWKRPILAKIATFPRLRGTMEDVFQDICIKFLQTRYLERFDPNASNAASEANYILTAVQRHCITVNRDTERREVKMDQEMAIFDEVVEIDDDTDILNLLQDTENELTKLQPWGVYQTLDGISRERSFIFIFRSLVHGGMEWSEIRDQLGYTPSAMTKIKKQFLGHPIMVNFYCALNGRIFRYGEDEVVLKVVAKLNPEKGANNETDTSPD